ncbi:YqiA/YcfP family alpha/beta fold hydrolase [Sulfurimonas sp. C5]|uniref:YqiA/YcfP family alpha/beta fold hydrolase n=1 Tax=Sulfurimonas sp. C5 TaxID=3036947 RepID=UPI0024552373|nr:YqiA/YcfP family alpha/beta fold hydrolase [Sulfurimonas sp. C5]MDH4944435.1 YqiA/YcfP family alpha/beta fold hydrolase [Sulfurimonas sp. C5]
MILYIHGFGSSGQGGKSKLFREYFQNKNIKFLAPSLSIIPDLAISTLEEIVHVCEDEEIVLMGSSLGGYYAIYLSEKYNLKAVLINPSIKPYETLKKVIGSNKSYYDGNFSFNWGEAQVNSLKKFSVDKVKKENYLLLARKGDEVLDYREAEKKLEGARMIIEEGGDHGFLDIDRYFKEISEFINTP